MNPPILSGLRIASCGKNEVLYLTPCDDFPDASPMHHIKGWPHSARRLRKDTLPKTRQPLHVQKAKAIKTNMYIFGAEAAESQYQSHRPHLLYLCQLIELCCGEPQPRGKPSAADTGSQGSTQRGLTVATRFP